MANPHRGEVRLVLDGVAHEMRLTLGALAELEAELHRESLITVIERFESGDFRTRDVMAFVVAGLRGGGWRGTAQDLLSAEIEGGLVAASKAVGQLLVLAFGPSSA